MKNADDSDFNADIDASPYVTSSRVWPRIRSQHPLRARTFTNWSACLFAKIVGVRALTMEHRPGFRAIFPSLVSFRISADMRILELRSRRKLSGCIKQHDKLFHDATAYSGYRRAKPESELPNCYHEAKTDGSEIAADTENSSVGHVHHIGRCEQPGRQYFNPDHPAVPNIYGHPAADSDRCGADSLAKVSLTFARVPSFSEPHTTTCPKFPTESRHQFSPFATARV
jgi:hypothetical protein